MSAQEILWQAVGQRDAIGLYSPVRFIGDIDGDGYDDLANIGQLPQRYGVIRVLSGRTGTILRTHLPPLPNYSYLRLERAGDWNGDGVRDYAATRWTSVWPIDQTVVEILSGRDDSVLFATPGGAHGTDGGYNILSDLDTDGDGRPDLVYTVGRETATAGAIYVYSNLGQLRYRLPANWGNSKLGKVGDVDHDGCDDFGYFCCLPGAVRVVSGRTGRILFEAHGENQNDQLGIGGIVACGDVNRDGTPDFAASANGCYPTPGLVRVFSGKDGSPIYTFRKRFDPFGSAFCWGESIASGFDLDQDGIQDLVVGGCQKDCDQVRQLGDRLYVYLLRDGREIEICTPGLASIQHFTWFGYEVAVGNPTPGNPFPVFACGEQQYGQSGLLVLYEGRVTLFRLPPAALRPYGRSCPGSLGRSPRAGMVDLGSSGVRMQVSDAPAGLPAVLLAGTSNQTWGSVPLPLALDRWGFIGCQLDTSIVLALPTLTGRAGMTEGYAALDIALPIANGASRGRLYAQWLVLGFGAQAPGALSSAMSWPY